MMTGSLEPRHSLLSAPLLDQVAQCAIARASLCGHPGQNRDSIIDIIDNQNVFLVIMLAMQTAGIMRRHSAQLAIPGSQPFTDSSGSNLS